MNMPYKFEVGIIELFEDHRISSFIRMTLESIPSEGLLYHLPVRIQETLLLDPKDAAHFLKLPLIENHIVLGIHS